MTRLQRTAALAALIAALLAIGACTVQSWRLKRATQRAESAEAAEAMTAAGWAAFLARAKVEAPIPVPAGARPVAVVVGTVPYGPRKPLSPGPGEAFSPAPSWTAPGPGDETPLIEERPIKETAPKFEWPTPADLAGGCSTTIVEAGGGWWAKSLWTGRLRLPDGGEVVRPDVELELQRVEVRRAVVADCPKRLALGVRSPKAWRTGWVAGAGVSYDPASARVAPALFLGYGVQF